MIDGPVNDIEVMTNSMVTKLKILRLHYNKTIADLAQNCLLSLSIAYGSINMIFDVITNIIINERSNSERLIESGEFFKQHQIRYGVEEYNKVPYNFYQFIIFIQKMSLSLGWNLDKFIEEWYEEKIDEHSVVCKFDLKIKSTIKNNDNKYSSSITSDGTYLYVLNYQGLFKIGTGFNESKRGYVYITNPTIYSTGDRNIYLYQKNKHEYLLMDNSLVTNNDFNFHKTFLLIDKGTLQDLYHIIVKAPTISTKTTFKDHLYFVDNSRKKWYEDSKLMFTCLDEKTNDLVIEELEVNEMFEGLQKNVDCDERENYVKQRYQLVYYSFVKVSPLNNENCIEKIKIPNFFYHRGIKDYYEIKDNNSKEIIGKLILTNCGNLWYNGDCQKFGLQDYSESIESDEDIESDDSNDYKWKKFNLSDLFIVDNRNEKIKHISYCYDIPDSILLTLDNGKILLLGKSIFNNNITNKVNDINSPIKLNSPSHNQISQYIKEEILLDNDKIQKPRLPIRRLKFNYNKKKIIKAILKKDFCVFLSETGITYVIGIPKLGKNNCFVKTQSETPEIYGLDNINVKDISFGKNHGVLIDKNLKVWSFGYNNKNQCGKEIKLISEKDKNIPIIQRTEETSPSKVLNKSLPYNSFCQNDFHTFSIDDPPAICNYCSKCSAKGNRCGYALTHNDNMNGKKFSNNLKKGDLCKCLTKSNGKIIGVCCRCGICKGCAIIINNYNKNMNKQNVEEKRKNINFNDHFYEMPTMLNINEQIIDVKTGDNHSLLLSKDGNVYSFGSNEYGQLGIEDYEEKLRNNKYINKINFPGEKIKIDQVMTGSNTSLAKSDNGIIYIWGIIEQVNSKEKIIKMKPTVITDIIKDIPKEDSKIKIESTLKNCSTVWFYLTNDSLIIQLRKNLLQSNYCDYKPIDSQLKLNDCKIISDDNCYLIMPKKSSNMNNISKYIILNRKREGTFRQYVPFNDESNYKKLSITFDTYHNDIIWCYNSDNCEILCYKKYLLKTIPHNINDYDDKTTKLNIHENNLLSRTLEKFNLPEFMFPDNINYISSINKMSDTEIGLIYLKNILCYTIISSLSHSSYENCIIREERSYDPENFKACVKNERNANIFPYPNLTRYIGNRNNDKNYCKIYKVSRFNSYSNGWSYYIPNALNAVEAISFKGNRRLLLCGLGLFGGKGNYKANVRIYKLKGSKKDDSYNKDELAELLGNEEVMYETGVQRFSSRREIDIYCVNLKKPIVIDKDEWYTIIVNMTGEPGFCGKNGKEKIRIDSNTGKEDNNGDIVITFKSSLAANNGTDVKVGQVPELFIELPKKDYHYYDSKIDNNCILTSPSLKNINVIMAETIMSTMTDETYNLSTLIGINIDGITNLLKITECTIDTSFGIRKESNNFGYNDISSSYNTNEDLNWNKERAISISIMAIQMLTYCMKVRYPKEYFTYKTNESSKYKYKYISNPLNIDFLYTEVDSDIIIRFYQLLSCIMKQASKRIDCNDEGIYSLAMATSESFVTCGYLFFSIKEVIMGNLIKCIVRSDMNKKVIIENYNYWKLYSLFKFILDNKDDGHIDDLYSFMKFYEPNFCGNEFGRRTSGCNVFENTKFGFELGQRLITSIDTIGYDNGTLIQRELEVTSDDFDIASKPINIIKFLFSFAFDKNDKKIEENEKYGKNFIKIRFKLKEISQKLIINTYKKIIKSYSNMSQEQNVLASYCRFSKMSTTKNWDYLNNVNCNNIKSTNNGTKSIVNTQPERSIDGISFSIDHNGVILYGFSIFAGKINLEKNSDNIGCMYEAEIYEVNDTDEKHYNKLLDHITGKVELLKLSKTYPCSNDVIDDEMKAFQCYDLFFSKPINLTPNMIYSIKISFYYSMPLITAISIPNCCYSTYYGENGIPNLQLTNGSKLTFYINEMCNNGTTVSRGQIPRILYGVKEEQSRIVERETSKEILRNLGDIIITHVIENTKILINDQKNIIDNNDENLYKNDNIFKSNIMDLNFMNEIISYSHIFSELDKRNTLIILNNINTLVKCIGPILMEMKCKYYAGNIFPENKILLSNYCRLYNGSNTQIVESDHPYKSGTFICQFVILNPMIDYMVLSFHPDSCTYMKNDKLTIYLVNDSISDKECYKNYNDFNLSGDIDKNYIKILTFSGRGKNYETNDGNWPCEYIILPGRRLLFLFETTTINPKEIVNEEDERYMYGFKCTINGYKNFINENKYFNEWRIMNMIERLEILEKELVFLTSDGCKLLMENQNKKNLNKNIVGWCEESERRNSFYEFINKHENILKKGIAFDGKFCLKDIIEDSGNEEMEINDWYEEEDDFIGRIGKGGNIERCFLSDFIDDKPLSKGSIFLREILFENNENKEIGSDRYGNIMAHVDNFDNLLSEFIDLRLSDIEVHLPGRNDDGDCNNGNLEYIEEQVLVGQKIILKLILKDQFGKILRNIDNVKKAYIEIRESIGEVMNKNIQYSTTIPSYISNIKSCDSFEEQFEGRRRAQLFSLMTTHPYKPSIALKSKYISMTINPIFQDYSFEEIRWSYMMGMKKLTKEKYEFNYDVESNSRVVEWIPKRKGIYKILAFIEDRQFLLSKNVSLNVEEYERMRIKGKRTIISFLSSPKDKQMKASWDYNLSNSGVRIRSCPSLQGYVIGAIVHTTRFNFIEMIENKEGIWLKVSVNEDGIKNFMFNKNDTGIPDKEWQYGYVLQYSKILNMELIRREDQSSDRSRSPFQIEVTHLSNEIKDLSVNFNNFNQDINNKSIYENDRNNDKRKIIYNDKRILLTPFVFKACRALFSSYLWHTNKTDKVIKILEQWNVKDIKVDDEELIDNLKTLWKKIVKEVLKYLENQRYIMSSIESMKASIQESDINYHNHYKLCEEISRDSIMKSNGNTLTLTPSPPGTPKIRKNSKDFNSEMGYCELCDSYYDKPITTHMKFVHPGCGAPSGGKGYNSVGKYTGGWSGSCGEGASSNCIWYILCNNCRDKYLNMEKINIKKPPYIIKKSEFKNSDDESSEINLEDKLEEDIIKKSIFLLKLNPYINPERLKINQKHHSKDDDEDDEVFINVIDGGDPEILHSILKRNSSLRKKNYSGSNLMLLNQNTNAISDPGPSKFSNTVIEANNDESKNIKVIQNLSTKNSCKRTARSQGNYREYDNFGSRDRSYSFLESSYQPKPIDIKKIEFDIFNFVFDNTQSLDLNLIRNNLKNSIKTSHLLSYCYQTFLNLIRIVSSEESIEDILFSHIETLSIFGENNYNYISRTEKKCYEFFKNLKILPHPGKICLLSGEESVKNVVNDFHNFMISLSLIIKAEDEVKEVQYMTIIERDKFRVLKNLCLKNWNFQYTTFDKDILIELCSIVKVLGNIMSSGSSKEGKRLFLNKLKEIKNENYHLWNYDGYQNESKKLVNITKKLKLEASSNNEILNAVLEENLESFWESSEDNKNNEIFIDIEFGNLAILKHKTKCSNGSLCNTIREVPELIAIYIDNENEKEFGVSDITFKGYVFSLECINENNKDNGSNEFVVLKNTKLKKNFKGWIKCYLGNVKYDLKKISIVFRGVDSMIRIRHIMVLAGEDNVMERKLEIQDEEGIVRSLSSPESAFGDSSDEEQGCFKNTPKVESDAFILFKAITGQIFEENLNENQDEPCNEDEKRFDEGKTVNIKGPNGSKLRNQILDYLFSKNHLEPIKGYVSVQIMKALQREVLLLKESKKKRLPKIKTLNKTVKNNMKYKYALNLIRIIEKLCSHNFDHIYDNYDLKSVDLLTSIEKVPLETKTLKLDAIVLFSELLEAVTDDVSTAKKVLEGIDKTIKMINISEKKNFIPENIGRKVIKNMLNIIIGAAEVGVKVRGQRNIEMFAYENNEIVLRKDIKTKIDNFQNEDNDNKKGIELIVKDWLEEVSLSDTNSEYGNWSIFIREEISSNIIEIINNCLGVKKYDGNIVKSHILTSFDDCYDESFNNTLLMSFLYDKISKNSLKLIEKQSFWMGIVSLSLLVNKQWLDISMYQNSLKGVSPNDEIKREVKELPFCENHDDFETRASLICHDCEEIKLCKQCFRTLHLSKKKRGHSILTLNSTTIEDSLNEDEDVINKVTVEVHEGSIRLKIENKLLILVNNRRLKGILEFYEIKNCDSTIDNNEEIHITMNRLKIFDNPTYHKSCRFCEGILKTEIEKISGVCLQVECQQYKGNVCKKIHIECGHLCNGVFNEKECLPCLRCTQVNDKINQDSEDLCSICYTDKLGSAPCIKVECGHIFHNHCLMKLLENKWIGPRISFRFMKCPLCLCDMEHKDKESKFEIIMNEYRLLYNDVRKKALMRYKYYYNAGVQKKDSKDIIEKINDDILIDEALQKFMYCLCFKCKKAYYGGDINCHQQLLQEDNDVDEENRINIVFKPEELVCGGCSNVAGGGSCKKHGTEYIEYKCRFCCSVAVYFCFGTTHFCQVCHSDFQRLMVLKPEELPKCPVGPKATSLPVDDDKKDRKELCPLRICHPDTGIEFSLGCGACRNIREF
uniref:RCR-type E3 ubiquitin transferase n=1 Tax=Parastrongyloides trichosuri TaxID=131310 RepID=A0A0N4Z1B8_PARTI